MILTMVPFRVKRVMLIVSTIIHAAFTGWLTYYFVKIISTMVKLNSVYSITRVPKVYIYVTVAFFLILSILRAVQEVIKLSHENEKELGKAIPAFDLEVIWQEGVQARDAYLKDHPEAAKEGKAK
jgi:TRAP-type C4-dicarboxylate transport system permease small subunit